MTTTEIEEAIKAASSSVLETMFFADAVSAPGEAVHKDPVACLLHCSGAEEGVFGVAADQEALRLLGCSFYGEDNMQLTQEQELICELTNMLAGSTLSKLAPDDYCELSSPQICTYARYLEISAGSLHEANSFSLTLQIDGGVLSAACSLRIAP